MAKYTINEFRLRYPDNDACLDKLFELRFANLICPVCEGIKPYARVKNRKAYQCPDCSHQIVNHVANEYVRGDYHTNTIENFWSNLKRTIKGTHISVSAKHLQKYVSEVAFRYSHRKEPEKMFDAILNRIASAA